MTLVYTGDSLFFFNDTTTTEIYTLSLHDALPISDEKFARFEPHAPRRRGVVGPRRDDAGQADGVTRRDDFAAAVFGEDRKSTRLNSSHANISYAVFCLKKQKTLRRPALMHILTPT